MNRTDLVVISAPAAETPAAIELGAATAVGARTGLPVIVVPTHLDEAMGLLVTATAKLRSVVTAHQRRATAVAALSVVMVGPLLAGTTAPLSVVMALRNAAMAGISAVTVQLHSAATDPALRVAETGRGGVPRHPAAMAPLVARAAQARTAEERRRVAMTGHRSGASTRPAARAEIGAAATWIAVRRASAGGRRPVRPSRSRRVPVTTILSFPTTSKPRCSTRGPALTCAHCRRTTRTASRSI